VALQVMAYRLEPRARAEASLVAMVLVFSVFDGR
jgi:hypothetical protein